MTTVHPTMEGLATQFTNVYYKTFSEFKHAILNSPVI